MKGGISFMLMAFECEGEDSLTLSCGAKTL